MTRTVLILSIAAAFVVGSIATGTIAFADDDDENGSFLNIVEWEVEVDDGELEVEIETAGNLPTDGSGGLFGVAVLTSGTNNVLAMTTHLCASDSPLQSNAPNSICPDANAFGLLQALTGGTLLNKDFDGADWHPHILDLKAADGLPGNPSGGCASIAGAVFEVDLAGTVGSGNNVSPTNYEFEVEENEIEVTAPLGGGNVNPDGTGIAVASFGIGATTDGAGNINDLCVLNPTFFPAGDD